ncbi:glycosyltransferase family 2 protein [Plantibacter sp. RU18]|uniref:glycosyltransferase family 2 protein n=1 Tax=Plantibacter sp. RU18 TaxID=3158143 RepID=UPI003D361DE4
MLAENLVAVEVELPEAVFVVVHNPTTTAERLAVDELGAQRGWTLVHPDHNLGFGGGVNLGVGKVLADSAITEIMLLNPDATIDAPSTTLLVERVRNDNAALVGPMIRRPDGRPWSSGHLLSLGSGVMRSLSSPEPADDAGPWMPWLSGACLVLSTELWRRVAGFDHQYFLYWEDVDLSKRVLDAGGSIVFVADALAVHDEGGTHDDGSGGSRAKSPTYYYYNILNRLRFAAIHLDVVRRRHWVRTSPRASWQILLRGGRRQFVHPVAPLGAAWRGHRDGCALVKHAAAPPEPYGGHNTGTDPSRAEEEHA